MTELGISHRPLHALGPALPLGDQPLHDRAHRGRVRTERRRDLLAAVGAEMGERGAPARSSVCAAVRRAALAGTKAFPRV